MISGLGYVEVANQRTSGSKTLVGLALAVCSYHSAHGITPSGLAR
jgi:hypothetical protein